LLNIAVYVKNKTSADQDQTNLLYLILKFTSW